MNYQKLYYFSFKNIKDELFIVEIWQDTTATITATEVVGDVDPCVLEYAALDSKLNPVHGSGVTLNMIATADHNFMDLYTGKIQEFLVKVYKESYLIWCGYLDPEMYSSPFSFNENYPVTFTCSDGFALLDRINYITPSDIELVELPIGHFVENGLKPYTGISSQWTIITNILTKLNLPVNYILVGISTFSNDFTLAYNETIFHKTLVINDNYVNETLEPETCRTVLEGILKPYGAFIIQVNGSIYITDLNFIANNDNQPFEAYNGVTFAGAGQSYINLAIGDLSTIGFMSDQSTMNIVSAVNKIVVSYSNYKGVEVINSDMTDFKTPGTPGANIGTGGFKWNETENATCDSWDKYNNGRFVTLNGVIPQTDKDNYLSINQYSPLNGYASDALNPVRKSFVFKKVLPYFIPNSGYKLKIEISAYFRKSDNLNDGAKPNKLKQGILQCNLVIGGKSAFQVRDSDMFQDRRGSVRKLGWSNTGSNISTPTYSTTQTPKFMLYFNNLVGYVTNVNYYNYAYIEDQWVSLNDNTVDSLNRVVNRDFLFPLDGFSGGLMTLEIYDYLVIPGLVSDDKNALKASIKEVRIKDVKFTVVDKDGKDLNISDTEYFSALDPNYLNDTKIELIHGTNVKGCPIEKASLLYDDGTAYQFCTSWTRNGQTNILEKLLQNTVKSNYLNPTLELTCNINNLPSLIGCVQYASQLGTNIFMVNSATIHLRDNITDLIIQTVSKDILNIV
jgi:hypothetical protein